MLIIFSIVLHKELDKEIGLLFLGTVVSFDGLGIAIVVVDRQCSGNVC